MDRFRRAESPGVTLIIPAYTTQVDRRGLERVSDTPLTVSCRYPLSLLLMLKGRVKRRPVFALTRL